MENVVEILKKTGALLNGHFLLSSGLHSDSYVQCAKVFEYPNYGEVVGKMLSEKLSKYSADVVVGPALGGVIVAYEVGKHLGIRAIFTERENEKMSLRRGFNIVEGEKVIIVEDAVTTGKSTKEVWEVVESHGGKVVAVGSIINRSRKENPFEVPYEYLVKFDFPTYNPDECPLCKQGIPVVKPGSRKIK